VAKWDRALSSSDLAFDDCFTARRLGGAGCAPRALIAADGVMGSFTVRVDAFSREGNSLTVGGVYGRGPSGTDVNKEGEFGLATSFGIWCDSKNKCTSVKVDGKSAVEAALLKPGDYVRVEWAAAGAAKLSVNSVCVWQGCFQAPRGSRRFYGASLANNAALRIVSTLAQRPRARYAESLLGDAHFADAQLVCADGAVLDVHRAVLAAASPVFRAMFQSGMREAHERRADVPASRAVATGLLRHVYTGEFDAEIDASATVELAHLYGLEDLAAFCCDLLVADVAPATVSECTRKIGRLRTLRTVTAAAAGESAAGAEGAVACGGSQGLIDQTWKRLSDRVAADPALVQALLESHAGTPEPQDAEGERPKRKRVA